MPRAFGSYHHHIYICGGNNLAEVDVEAVGKGKHIARFQVGLNGFFIDGFHHLVGQQNHHPVGQFSGICHRLDGQPLGFGLGNRTAAFVQTDNDIDPTILKV